MFRYLFLIVLLTNSTLSYGFDPSSSSCEFVFHDGAKRDGEALDLLKTVGSEGAVKICEDRNGRLVYDVASPISKKDKISYFYLTRVFKLPLAEGGGWSYRPSDELSHLASQTTYMQRAVAENVKHDDSGFVPVLGVSPALFGVLDRAWDDILSSEDVFDEASKELSIFAKLTSDAGSLKNAIYGANQDVPRILSVDFVQGNASSYPRYELSLFNQSHVWLVDFDFTDAGIRIENVIQVSR